MLCLIWGSTWMAIKIGLADAPPMYALSIRFLLSAAIMNVIVLVRGLPLPRTLSRWLALGYPGIFTYGLAYALVYWAETCITSSLTAVLFASFPFFVALFSLGLLKQERLTATGWWGLAIGFAGIVTVSSDSLQTSADLFLGSTLAVGGTAAAAFGTVAHKRAYARENIYVAATVQMTLGTIPVALLAPITDNWSDIVFSGELVGSILYLSLIGTVAAFIAYYWLLANIRAIFTSLFAFIVPLVARSPKSGHKPSEITPTS
jgi:drug/metabolite transporter (DMT)-like permease